VSPLGDCPTSRPCLRGIGPFVQWCRQNAAGIDRVEYLGHEASQHQPALYAFSHIVAYDSDGNPMQCAVLHWETGAWSMGWIAEFRDDLLLDIARARPV
jgi:hypothetical protein